MTGSANTPGTDLDAVLGVRVALRHRIGERDGRPLFTDAVGTLSDGGAGTVVVQTRKGAVRVAREAVVAVRAVPPAPPRRASWSAVSRLESLCADAWPALVDEPLGAWRLRAADGFTGRANSCLAIGDPGLPIPAALAAVEEFAAAHEGVPARLQTPVGSRWSTAAQHAGWVLDDGHEAGSEVAVLVADLTLLTGSDGRVPVSLTARATSTWWEFGVGAEPTRAQRHVLDPGPAGPPTVFGLATVFAGQEPLGAVRGALVEDHLHLSRLDISPAARRSGVGTALTAAVARWGLARGARWAVLQVALDNTGARRFYERLGCTEHHRYHYLVPAPLTRRDASPPPGPHA
ncbi:MAG: GNAT family N-acetyltransferase [Pseudonocardia sp.]|nr:GNAT family N-acetyltransferase [Pseudonocardia sp.]